MHKQLRRIVYDNFDPFVLVDPDRHTLARHPR